DITVVPSEPVNADFTVEQVFDCDNLLITTQNNSTGSNILYDWQLSDGGQYASENMEHTFSGAGTYSIILTVSDSMGCSPPSLVSMDVVIDPIVPVVADFALAQVGNCVLLTVETINNSTGDSISLSWDMGDGTIYTDDAPTHVYIDPGTYNVTLTVSDLGCGNDDQMIFPIEMINELPIVTLGDTVVCPDATAELIAGGTPGNYIWSTGDTTQAITVSFGGTYTVLVTTDVCQGSATVQVIQGLEMELAYEVDACPNESVELSVPIEGLAYEWNTGGDDRIETVVGEGEYIFDVVDLLGCPHTDTVTVIALDEDPQLFAPNAFSPDGDGINEIFQVVGYGEKDVEFTVYNRWGERLWASTSAADGWDGQYNGTPVKNDVYVYQLKYTGICNAEEREVIGHVTVLR
ncbi:MAG: PKD domain-containing protein, partial [Bacteroidota bacterium]|nr:PKD domain-containing protein [Bacteroidota bacterium]